MTEAEARVIQAAEAWDQWWHDGAQDPDAAINLARAVEALRLERNPPPVRHTVEWRQAKAGERSVSGNVNSPFEWVNDSVAPAWVIVDDPKEPR